MKSDEYHIDQLRSRIRGLDDKVGHMQPNSEPTRFYIHHCMLTMPFGATGLPQLSLWMSMKSLKCTDAHLPVSSASPACGCQASKDPLGHSAVYGLNLLYWLVTLKTQPWESHFSSPDSFP